MILALIFSRISPQSALLNGTNPFSQILYFLGLILFISNLGLTYIRAYKRKNERIIDCFKRINLIYILVLAFSFWGIVSIRGAIRLFFILSPIIIIASSFIFVEVNEYKKDSNKKVIWAVLLILVLFFAQIFTSYTLQTEGASKSMIPSAYNQQWQRAMQWVRENTTQGSIFIHWWDYGYWVQSIGERPTVVDGGHPSGFWDHLVGRYILTATSPEMALSMMKTDNVSYLLIDSSDIGKYPAYSIIGSDATGEDRYSQIPILVVDPKQTKETSNKTMKVYTGGGMVDEDIVYNAGENSSEIFIPKENSYIVFIIYESTKSDFGAIIDQPRAIFYYSQQQISIPIRYVYYQEKLLDFKGGLNATISLIPSITSAGNNQGQIDESGAAIYLSPRVTNSLFAQLYLLNSKAGRYSEFELAYSEQDAYINYLNSVGLGIKDFAYISGGVRGPIKIWKVNPDEDILVNEEFLRTSGEYAEFDNLTFVKD